MKHAPVSDAFERLILIAMADAADEDGCNSYRSMRSHMRIAKDVSKSTIVRRQSDMAQRGLIRPDTTPPPQRYLDIPEYKRPQRWEVCIPCSWWSESQLEEVNRRREDLGLEPITPENRPDLPEAPKKPKRADKGVPAPQRGRKKKQAKGGVPETPPQESDLEPERGCLEDTRGGVPETRGRGVLKTPNPPSSDLPAIPSSPPTPPNPNGFSVSGGPDVGREDDYDQEHKEQVRPTTADPKVLQERALELVDAAVRLWPTRHKAPGARDRQRLADRISTELATDGVKEVILHELTRDLQDAGSALSVIMGSRTTVTGWGQPTDPRPDYTRYEIPRSAPWCGLCDERTRLIMIRDVNTGKEHPGRCRQPVLNTAGETVACNPNTTPSVFDQAPEESDDALDTAPEMLAQQMRDSLTQAEETGKGRASFRVVKEALERTGAEAAGEEAARLSRRR